MNVRIVSGKFGGRRLEVPKNDNKTHPMGERVRSALFNILGDSVVGANVLDAYAGTGALGLEALSRGANRAAFIEQDRSSLSALRQNIEKLDVGSGAIVIKANLDSWKKAALRESFDLIFADPPYDDVKFSTVVKLIDYLKPNGLMVLSHPGRECVPTNCGVVVVDNRSYGNAVLTFYRKDEAQA